MSIIFVTFSMLLHTRCGSAPRVNAVTDVTAVLFQMVGSDQTLITSQSSSHFPFVASHALPQLGIHPICGDQEVQKKSPVILRTAPNSPPAAV